MKQIFGELLVFFLVCASCLIFFMGVGYLLGYPQEFTWVGLITGLIVGAVASAAYEDENYKKKKL